MKTETSLLIIYTGGTIGMIKNEENGALEPFDLGDLYSHIPILKQFNFELGCYSFNPLIDSSDMNPEFWIELANVIKINYEAYDGFVVLHGTDTMSYTASMLSFMLENLNKPVIFTGSQLPLSVIRSDGRDNFVNAIEMAAGVIDDTPIVPEVTICFENKLFRGNRTIKYNAEDFDAFISGNYPPLAEVGIKIRYNHHVIRKPNFRKLKVADKLCNDVAVLKLFPGINRSVVHATLTIPNLRGIILETFGAGNAPTEAWFLEELQTAIKRDVIIYSVTQCKEGAVEFGLYNTSLGLSQIGVISGYDITTEAAIAKMMYLFGRDLPIETTKSYLQQSLRGELTVE